MKVSSKQGGMLESSLEAPLPSSCFSSLILPEGGGTRWKRVGKTGVAVWPLYSGTPPSSGFPRKGRELGKPDYPTTG